MSDFRIDEAETRSVDEKVLLLVDDEPRVAMDEKRLLERNGYTVHAVHYGEEAVQRAVSDEKIDLVLMDIDLGEGMDGPEAAEGILLQRDIPIVFLCDEGEREPAERRVRGITGYGYVLKSSGEFALLESIRMAFRLWESQLRVQEGRRLYRSLFDTIGNAVFVLDTNGVIIEINDAVVEQYGFKREELAGEKISRFDLHSSSEEIAGRIRRIIEDGAADFQTVHTLKNGEERFVEVTARKMDYLGRDVVLSVCHDISKRREFERQLRRQNDFMHTIIESLSHPFYVVDVHNYKLRLANRAATAGNEGRSLTCYAISHGRDTPCGGTEHPCPLREVMETKEPAVMEHIHVGPNGEPRYVEVHGFPVMDESAEVTQMIEYSIDITGRKLAEQETARAMRALARSNRELEQFAYIASHDLQEPLRMVSSYTQLLERRYKDKLDEKANKYIYYAVDGASRMQMLINDLLDYSRVGTKGKTFTEFSVSDALAKVQENLQRAIDETAADIHTGALPLIRGDRPQIERLLQNLIGNALKFRRDDEKLRIRIQAEERESDYLFTIEDNGIGIDLKYREKIFTIFQRLHTRSEYPGTGIGLSICKRIVERHGGEIWLDSEPGKGTTFSFTIRKELEEES